MFWLALLVASGFLAAWWILKSGHSESARPRGGRGARSAPPLPVRRELASRPVRRFADPGAETDSFRPVLASRSESAPGIVVEEVDPSFYADVASMLEQQIEADPKRTDLHTTLLELHHAAGRAQAFRQAAHQFAGLARPEQWGKVVELGLGLGIDLAADGPAAAVRPLRAAASVAPVPAWNPPVKAAVAVDPAPRRPPPRPAPRAAPRAAPRPPAPIADDLDDTSEMPLLQRTFTPTVAATGQRHFEHESIDATELELRLEEVRAVYRRLRRDVAFLTTFAGLVSTELARPSPLYYASDLTARVGGAKLYFKREDLRAENTERLFNALGQALVARFAGRRRLICGSSAGGSVRAYVAAARLLKLEATVFVGERVDEGALTGYPGIEVVRLRDPRADPRRAALARWLQSGPETFYVSGLKAGPDPYPTMASDFQAISGHEVLRQLIPLGHTLPTAVVSSVEAGLAATGICQPFLDRAAVELVMVKPVRAGGTHAAADGESGLMREHRWLAVTGRVQFSDVADAAADDAASLCLDIENLYVKPHNARALAHAIRLARGAPHDAAIVVLLGPEVDPLPGRAAPP